MDILRLVYFSQYRVDPSRGPVFSQLNQIIDSSNRNNKARNITGALLFDSNWFVQCLEGALTDVWGTFQRIEHDHRHANICFLEMTKIPSRRFGNWWMGDARRTPENAALFAPYLYNGRFVPDNMAPDVIVSLLIDLTWDGFMRDLAASKVVAG